MITTQRQNKTNTKNNPPVFAIVSILIIILFNINNVSAISAQPKGIEGIVYHLDGTTQAQKNIPVTITNLGTQEKIIGYTGKGTSGRYSFSINWEGTPLINVSVENPEHSAFEEIALSGSLRNVHLYLDMNISNSAPNITSNPETVTLIDSLYEYQVLVFDWNDDEIFYSLVEAPENMTITSEGLISWTPTKEQFGTHTVIINVSDYELYTLQEYELETHIIKDNPNIVSEPITSIKRNQIYEYALLVVDDDYDYLTYEVFRGAPGMYFENNVLKLEINNTHSGEYIIILDVKDRFNLVARQIYILTIEELPPKYGRTIIQNEEEIQEQNETTKLEESQVLTIKGLKEFTIQNPSFNIIKKITIPQNEEEIILKISFFEPATEKIKTTNTRTYAYFSLKPDKEIKEQTTIQFYVSEEWLERNGLNPDNILLLKYENGYWTELPTSFLEKTNNHYLFSAKSNGLSYFAISHDARIKEFPKNIDVNILKIPFIISGKFIFVDDNNEEVLFDNKDLQKINKNIKITILNKNTNKTFFVETMIIGERIIYDVLITGNEGDEVEIKIIVNNKEILINKKIQNTIQEEEINIPSSYLNNWTIKQTAQTISFAIFIIIIFIIFMIVKKNILKKQSNNKTRINDVKK